jgi:hypothetical protein
MGIQDNWRNQMVVKDYKNQQTSPYLNQSDLSSSNNDRCIPNNMGCNISSSKTKSKDKPKKKILGFYRKKASFITRVI